MRPDEQIVVLIVVPSRTFFSFYRSTLNMATVKVILRTQKVNAKGESPLYLRISRHRKASFISLGIM